MLGDRGTRIAADPWPSQSGLSVAVVQRAPFAVDGHHTLIELVGTIAEPSASQSVTPIRTNDPGGSDTSTGLSSQTSIGWPATVTTGAAGDGGGEATGAAVGLAARIQPGVASATSRTNEAAIGLS